MHLFSPTKLLVSAGTMLFAGGTVALGNPQSAAEQQVTRLQYQNKSLQESLAESNRSARESATALATIKAKLEALDRSVFTTKDEDLIEAFATIDSLTEANAELETAATALVTSIELYLSSAITSDPDLRVAVEESIRNLDSTLGMRQKPRPQIDRGTLTDAKVVTIDTESGLLVFNVGSSSDARIGMTFQLRRGDQPLGEATLVDVRSSVSGAFVDTLYDQSLTVRAGDAVSVVTQ